MPVNDDKRKYGAKLGGFITKYKSIFLVGVDNVGKQMSQVRVALRPYGDVLMGKNTTMRKVIKDFLKKEPEHPIANLLPLLIGNVGLVFTNADLSKVRDIIVSNKVPAPARIGAVSPVDVYVEPGPTGCDPGQTAWFQALNIPTKINKGQIEMISRVHLIKETAKVTDSQAALLQKLNIKPFSYGVKVLQVYENGAIFEPAVLDVKEDDLFAKFFGGVATFAAASLGLGLPNKATIVHSVNDAFKSLLAIALGTDFKFARAKPFEDFLANPGAFAGAAPAAEAAAGGGAAPAKAAEVKKEEEPEEDMPPPTFGGDDDDW